LLKDSTVSEYARIQKALLFGGGSYILVSESWRDSAVLMNSAPKAAFGSGNIWLLVPWDFNESTNVTDWILKFLKATRVQPNLILIVTSSEEFEEERARIIKREVVRRVAIYRADQRRVFGDPQAERKLIPILDPAYTAKIDEINLENTIQDWLQHRGAERNFYKSLFEKTPQAYITTALIIANAAVYIAMAVSARSPFAFSLDDLIRWGANSGPKVHSGEWWRLFSAAFIHVNLLHIFFNMWCLWNLGGLAERAFGNARFFVIYLLSALGGSIASISFHPEIVSAGASGAVFGISGCLVSFLWKNQRNVPEGVYRRLKRNMIQFIGFNILFGLVNPVIDNAAHIGGLVTGFLAGAMFSVNFGEAERYGEG
jgi:membrane associated rhomboid family serine protease